MYNQGRNRKREINYRELARFSFLEQKRDEIRGEII